MSSEFPGDTRNPDLFLSSFNRKESPSSFLHDQKRASWSSGPIQKESDNSCSLSATSLNLQESGKTFKPPFHDRIRTSYLSLPSRSEPAMVGSDVSGISMLDKPISLPSNAAPKTNLLSSSIDNITNTGRSQGANELKLGKASPFGVVLRNSQNLQLSKSLPNDTKGDLHSGKGSFGRIEVYKATSNSKNDEKEVISTRNFNTAVYEPKNRKSNLESQSNLKQLFLPSGPETSQSNYTVTKHKEDLNSNKSQRPLSSLSPVSHRQIPRPVSWAAPNEKPKVSERSHLPQPNIANKSEKCSKLSISAVTLVEIKSSRTSPISGHSQQRQVTSEKRFCNSSREDGTSLCPNPYREVTSRFSSNTLNQQAAWAHFHTELQTGMFIYSFEKKYTRNYIGNKYE